jgi:hypothetical protein
MQTDAYISNARPARNGDATVSAFTAAQIAAALAMKRQAVQWHLRGVEPATRDKIVNGQAAAAWTPAQLPPALIKLAEAARVNGNYRTLNDVFTNPRSRWQPPLPINKICDADIQAATKLRDALKPWLIRQHDIKPGGLKAGGVESYARIFGHPVTPRFWDELFNRTVQRDGGREEWNNLAIYLPVRLKQKETPADVVSAALADDFAELENFIAACINPHDPSEAERVGLWALARQKFAELVRAGQSEKSAARRVRQFLFARAKFLAPSRNSLRMAFERKLDKWQRDNPDSLADGRKANGDRPEYSSADIRRVRHSAVLKNGSRIDSAWREEYPLLSEYTRQRHPRSRKCPRAFYQLVNRLKVDALCARLQGKRKLRKMVGSVTRNADGIHTMARWAVDDWTSNVVVAFRNPDGTVSLIQPQIITVMDFASRKWVGWSMSNDKGPTAELVCAAILDGFRRHDVPRKLYVENGFTFGKSLNVNGKVDDQGRTVVAGLAQYGCAIHHFDKMSPTSKGELEKSFDLFQRQMERHPGYAGRLQMLDASDDFKRETRLINSGKVDATKFRYTFAEFIRVMHRMIEEWNAAPQFGHLHGLTPNEAFEVLKDANDPPIKFDNRLLWMLANERYRVTVAAGGVSFRHYGRKIQVRGGELPQHAGEEFWALVDRQDCSMVTFMSLDHRKTFTVETCQQPSADEPRIATGCSVLANELKKISTHMRAVDTELKDLTGEFGNPRRDLLAQIRGATNALAGVADGTTRRVILNSRIESSAEQMHAQRQAITAKRRQNTANKSKARRLGIPAVLVEDDDQSRRALELLGDTAPANSLTELDGKFVYQLKPSGHDQIKYVDYLVEKLAKLRKAGAGFGQKFTGEITFGSVKKIAAAQLHCDLHDVSRFDEISSHLKAAIDATILGKRNLAKGTANYHEFFQTQEMP